MMPPAITRAARTAACPSVIGMAPTISSATTHCKPVTRPGCPSETIIPARPPHSAVTNTAATPFRSASAPTIAETAMPAATRTVSEALAR